METEEAGPAYKGMLPLCSVPTVPGSSDLGWLQLVRSRFSNLCPMRSAAYLNMSDQIVPSMDFFLLPWCLKHIPRWQCWVSSGSCCESVSGSMNTSFLHMDQPPEWRPSPHPDSGMCWSLFTRWWWKMNATRDRNESWDVGQKLIKTMPWWMRP